MTNAYCQSSPSLQRQNNLQRNHRFMSKSDQGEAGFSSWDLLRCECLKKDLTKWMKNLWRFPEYSEWVCFFVHDTSKVGIVGRVWMGKQCGVVALVGGAELRPSVSSLEKNLGVLTAHQNHQLNMQPKTQENAGHHQENNMTLLHIKSCWVDILSTLCRLVLASQGRRSGVRSGTSTIREDETAAPWGDWKEFSIWRGSQGIYKIHTKMNAELLVKTSCSAIMKVSIHS